MLAVASLLLYWLSILTYFTVSASLLFLLLLIIHKVNKKRRVFVFAEVISVKEVIAPIVFRSPLSGEGRLTLKLYNILASDRKQVFRFLTPTVREVGENIILLLDRRGRVLAVSKKGSGEDIELLRKLR